MSENWTAQTAAAKWGITAQSVKLLIHRGRVPGAKLKIVNGRSTWVIPPQEKPTRNLRKSTRDKEEQWQRQVGPAERTRT